MLIDDLLISIRLGASLEDIATNLNLSLETVKKVSQSQSS
jgi:DNA-binding NarL/FixJ family response regulator